MSVIMASVVGIKPKPQFMGLFQFIGTHSSSPTTSGNKSSEPDEGSELALTGWWRRGRDELYLNHGPAVLVLDSWTIIHIGASFTGKRLIYRTRAQRIDKGRFLQ